MSGRLTARKCEPEQVATCRMAPGKVILLFAATFILGVTTMQSPTAAQQVVVLVNGSPITTYDIEQRAKFEALSNNVRPRQEVIEELIEEKMKVQEAKRYGMEASNADIDRAVANMASRAGMSLAQFTQFLATRGVDLGTIRTRMRADIIWAQLVRGRFPATLQIEEPDIRDVLSNKKEEGETVAYDYRLRPILLIVPKGSAASVVEGRVREAEGLRTRFQSCDDGIALARSLRDVAVRDPVRRTSADLPPALREVLDNTPVGKLTKPEVTAQGVELFALCERLENKSDTPQKRSIRAEIFGARFETQSKRYLSEVRRSSMIEYK